MTVEELLPLLSNVRGPVNGRYRATCPSHADKYPSLSVQAGTDAILFKCWSGCTKREILSALGLTFKQMWYEEKPDKAAMRKAGERKARLRREKDRAGRVIDALREADDYVRSRKDLCIDQWDEAKLDHELERLGKAYQLLETEPFYYE